MQNHVSEKCISWRVGESATYRFGNREPVAKNKVHNI